MGFVFYDTETTGLHTAFSQILQFAAIHTDDNLNETERFEIRCQLLPHIVPAPQAMLTTGVTVKQLTDKTLPTHYEMIRAIRSKLRSWSPSVFIGYNSFGYDEPLLRQAFYQTLHPPYLTNTFGNSRADALKMMQGAALCMPHILNVPCNEKQQPVFKLDRIAPANGFAHDNAHDALADVEATIYMCRIIKEKAQQLWSGILRFSQKAAVTDYVLTESVFCLSEFYYNRPYSYLVTTIGTNPDREYEILVLDLANDPDALDALTLEALTARLKQSPKPVRSIKPNACPLLMSLADAPITEATALGAEELQRRVQSLHYNHELRQRLIAAYNMTKEEIAPSPHVEEQIYDSFSSMQDQRHSNKFHEVAWEERAALLTQFEDERLRTLARRLIYFERPDLLEESVCKELDVDFAKRLLALETTVPWLTLPKAIAEIEYLLDNPDAEKHEFLKEHREFLLDRLEQAMYL